MKAIFKSSILLLFASVTLWSCKKDETKTILKPGGALTLTSSATTLVLQQANAASTATILTWGKADFGYSAAITYTIQLCKGGTNFASPATTTEIGMGTALTKPLR